MRANEFVTERKKHKRKSRYAAYGPGPYGGYGYYAGYSGDSSAGGDAGGDGGGGGGESIKNEDAMMAKIEDDGKIVRILKKQHSVPFSDEKNWLLIDTDPAKGNKGLGLKWIPADTRFTWVRPYRDTVEQGVAEGKEEYNRELNQKGFFFEQEIDGVTYRVSNVKGGSNNIKIQALDKKQQVIANALFWRHQYQDGLESLSTYVDPAWQGKGIATNMYAVMRMLGVNIHPATHQSDDGKKMWDKWRKSGDAKHIKSMNAKMTGVAENFADGRNPQDKGDSKRHGVPTKASVSTLRKVAKQGGRKGQLAHWMANMKSGRSKKK